MTGVIALAIEHIANPIVSTLRKLTSFRRHTGSHVKGDFPIIIHFDLSMPYLNLHLSLYIVHISLRRCKSLAFVENTVISSAYAIEL